MKHRLFLISLILILIPLPFVEARLRTVPPTPRFAFALTAEQEAERAAFARAIRFDRSGQWLEPGSFTGQWYSANDGIRHTTGQPPTWTNSLYLLGPSTVLDAWNPDTRTLASQLQRLLSQYRVVNLGIEGGSTGTQYARLRSVRLQSGDIVILYSGDAEGGQVATDAASQMRRVYSLSPCGWLLDQAPFIALVRSACHWYESPAMSHDDLQAKVDGMLPAYRRWVDRMQAYTMQVGASFMMVLAPYQASRSLSPWEAAFAARSTLALENERLAYPLFRQAFPGALDLSHVLDTYRDSHDVYHDAWHLTGDANALVAKAIYDWLAPLF